MSRRKVAVVDGSNVAYLECSQDGKPKTANLMAVRRVLQDQGYEVIIIVDASLRHVIDDPDQLEHLIDTQIVRQAPAGTDADYFVIVTAEEQHGLIISNDQYEPYQKQYSWITQRRCPLMIIKGRVELYDGQALAEK